MQINLNEQQANVLVNLIDLAVKSAGLQAAEAGVFFTKLIHINVCDALNVIGTFFNQFIDTILFVHNTDMIIIDDSIHRCPHIVHIQ